MEKTTGLFIVPYMDPGNTGERYEQTRIRINFKVSAKGEFQPDITSEAETVDTAMLNLDDASKRLDAWATENGIKKDAV